MPEQRFDIFFSGQLIKGKDPADVKLQIGKIFNASEEHIAHLFSGRAVKIKANVDQDSAIKYRIAFRNAGALIEIRATDAIATTAVKQQHPPLAAKTADHMALLPPHTGSLIDCAIEVEAAPMPDISNINLAATGTDIDETSPPPPANIDTSKLELNPANSGSLEDCQIAKTPFPTHNIDHMKLNDGGKSGKR